MLGPRIVAATVLGSLTLAFVACGANHPPPADVDETGGSAGSSSGAAAGHAGATTTSGAAAGTTSTGGGVSDGGSESGGGTGGSQQVAECGNDIAEEGEDCDGDDLGSYSCASLGFDEGTLACNDCELDFSDCSGTESCQDFRDNDGDRAIDCADDDCTEICAAPCDDPPDIGDPAVVEGTLAGRSASDAGPSCSAGGPELFFQLTAANTGLLEASVTSSDAVTVSLRTACDDVDSELKCAYGSHIAPEVTEGETVFVVVAGLGETDDGAFTLNVASRAITCGDGYRDGDEECDDGNEDDDDGCSATCELESSESNANDQPSQADEYVDPFFGSISDAGDEDWIEFSVAAAPGALAIDTFDLGDGACARKELDSLLELYDADGALVTDADGVEVIDDDGGAGYCAKIVVGDLPAGTYYVRVLPSPAGQTPSFPYRLSVDVDSCGNGRQAEAEECDDGNRIDWDGCDSECKLE